MDHMDVYPLVKETVEAYVAGGEQFTAWDITVDLKRHNDVQHKDVRPSVHTIMLGTVDGGDYRRELQSYHGGDAWLYIPTRMPTVPMYAVVSANGPSAAIAEIGYDHVAGDLLVTFNSGGTYRYNDVPARVFVEFLNADSKGQFYHARIKDVYT